MSVVTWKINKELQIVSIRLVTDDMKQYDLTLTWTEFMDMAAKCSREIAENVLVVMSGKKS